MKKILFLLLLFGGFLQAQITPCPTYYTSKFLHKVDSVYLNATSDSIIVIDSFSKRTAIAISKNFKELNRFHVDPNGNDANIGSDESPVLTIAKGLTLLGQGDVLVVGEGVYNETVSMSLQNTTMSGETGGYASLTQISTINVTTTSGTSNRISDLIVGTLNHSGGAPLFLSNASVSTLINKTSSAYFEAKNSSLQGTSTNTFSAGINYIENSKMGTSIFSGTNTVATLKDVIVDAGDSIVIGAGVIYDIQNVTGKVIISPSAIPINLALQSQGLSAEYSKAYETDYANKLAMINPDSVATSTNVVVWSNSTKRLEYTAMPKGGVYMDTLYSNATRDTLSYVKNGTTYKVPLNKIDTTSFFYRLRQLNDSTILYDRKDGTSDTLSLSMINPNNQTYGDIKTGIQTTDHNGWIKLDGRTKSTLTATQQTRATALGIGTNLPDATNSVLMQNGTALGSVSGSMSKTIAQNQLPNVNLTAQSAGAHNHGLDGGYIAGNGLGGYEGNIAGGSGFRFYDRTTTDGAHTHTVPLNGNVTQQALDITPRSLSVNTFIYLGN